ncbi:hypothetical protein K439DRAFT_157622 [Ramaria rubella]|nr:hypothetical protein K439DRAFT_157622 [Ramaria rubella]
MCTLLSEQYAAARPSCRASRTRNVHGGGAPCVTLHHAGDVLAAQLVAWHSSANCRRPSGLRSRDLTVVGLKRWRKWKFSSCTMVSVVPLSRDANIVVVCPIFDVFVLVMIFGYSCALTARMTHAAGPAQKRKTHHCNVRNMI